MCGFRSVIRARRSSIPWPRLRSASIPKRCLAIGSAMTRTAWASLRGRARWVLITRRLNRRKARQVAGRDRTLRGRVAVVGIGETEYYRHGAAPDAEFKLALKAILAACHDAGLDPRDIDGFASYSDGRCDASPLAPSLETHRLTHARMLWGGTAARCLPPIP